MCRVEERVYIGSDGRRQVFEDKFPCDKSHKGKLCSEVKRKTTEYSFGGKSVTSNQGAIESPGSEASYTLRTGFADVPVPPTDPLSQAQGYRARHDVPKSHHRHVSSSSSQTTSSQPPSLYATSEPESSANSTRQLPVYPRTIHNPPPGAAPPSPSASRATAPTPAPAPAPASPSYRTKTVSPQKLSRENVGAGGLTPLDYSEFVDHSASSHASSSPAPAPEITDRGAYRERRGKRKDEEKKLQEEAEEADRRLAEQMEKEVKQMRFERGRAAKQRGEQKFAESEKRRAEVREDTRREKEDARRRKKEPEERPPIKKPEQEKTKAPTREHTRRHRSSKSAKERVDVEEDAECETKEEEEEAERKEEEEAVTAAIHDDPWGTPMTLMKKYGKQGKEEPLSPPEPEPASVVEEMMDDGWGWAWASMNISKKASRRREREKEKQERLEKEKQERLKKEKQERLEKEKQEWLEEEKQERLEKEEKKRLKREAREAEEVERTRIEAEVAEKAKEAEASSGCGGLHVPSNPLLPDAQLAAVPNNGQSSSYKQALESMDTASIEHVGNLVPSSILTPFESVNPAGSPFDDMRTMLYAKARIGKAFPETRLKGTEDIREGSSMNQKNTRDNEDDSASVISSYATSIFSTLSLASSATDLAKSSGYSPGQIATATKELVSIFGDDENLVPLYKFAIRSPMIGPERLQRNLRRLFKKYAEKLEEEATDGLEYLAPRFVSMKARYLAQTIVEKYQGTALARIEREMRKDVSSDDDGEDEAKPVDEGIFEDLILLREFLVGSDAFHALRSQVQSFVHPQVKPSKPETVIEEKYIDDMWSRKGFYESLTFGIEWIGRTLRRVFDAFWVATGQLEPPLARGRVRLRWQCRCGDTFSGDVMELRKGGVTELIGHMQRSSEAKVLSKLYSQSTNNRKYIYQRLGLWIRKAFLKIAGGFKRAAKMSSLPQHSNPSASTCCQATGNNPSQQQMLHMMACMHKGRHRKNLCQDRIDAVNTDRELFVFLRKQFLQQRGRLRNIVSLKAVRGIFFVKFRLPIGGSVEVRYHDPCCVHSSCECIPPAPKVEPSPNAEYRCKPGPPATYPPICPEYLMHLFASPSCINENDTWILDQVPKRTCGELHGKAGQPAEGWGIYYQEGWDQDLITLVVFAVLMCASLLFGVLWSKFKMDIQGAFSVSAYMATVCAVLISLVAMRADKA